MRTARAGRETRNARTRWLVKQGEALLANGAAALACWALLAGCGGRGGETVSILAGGDCRLERGPKALAAAAPKAQATAGPDRRWSVLRAAAKGDRAFLFNLETSVGEGGRPRYARFASRAPSSALELLASFRRPVAALANDHAMDFGPAGLRATMAALDDRGIARVGAGKNAEDASRALVLRAGGEAIAVLAFGLDDEASSYDGSRGACIAPIDLAAMAARVEAAKAESQAVVVMLHWGHQHDARFEIGQRDIALALVKAGADLIVGSGPGVMQGLEVYRGSLICYSLGSLDSGGADGAEAGTGALVRMILERKGGSAARKRFELAPLREAGSPRGAERPSVAEAARMIEELAKRSPDPGAFGRKPRVDADGLAWFRAGK